MHPSWPRCQRTATKLCRCGTDPFGTIKPAEQSAQATEFVVDYVRLEGVNVKKYSTEQKAYLKKKESQYQTLRKNSERFGAEESVEAMKFFLKVWLREWEERQGRCAHQDSL